MAQALLPLINGKSYEYADITCVILGVPIVGITAIEYAEVANITNVYATGRYPVSRGHGTIEPTAKITMLMEEVNNIVSVAPNGRLYDIPEFDIIVTYTDVNLVPVVHKINNVRFKNNKVGAATGDTSIPVELDLVPSHISWS